MTETTFTTYHSTNAKPSEAWIAYINGWQVRCVGATEDEAKARALNLWNRERARWGNVPHSDAVKTGWNDVVPSAALRTATTEAKQHHLAGKVWMINRTTGDKRRVDPYEVNQLMANGYVRGGPRSK